MSTMLKQQQFNNSESDKTESSVSKRQRLDMHDHEEGQSLNKYEDKGKNEIYISVLFIIYLFLF